MWLALACHEKVPTGTAFTALHLRPASDGRAVMVPLRRCTSVAQLKGVVAVAVAERDLGEPSRRRSSAEDSAGGSLLGEGAAPEQMPRVQSRTKELLMRQGAKWRSEARSWAEAGDIECSVSQPPSGTDAPSFIGEVQPGTFIRRDLMEYLAQNPAFGALPSTGMSTGSSTIVKTNRPVGAATPSATRTTPQQDSLHANASDVSVEGELGREVFSKSPLTQGKDAAGTAEPEQAARSMWGGAELINRLQSVMPPQVAPATQPEQDAAAESEPKLGVSRRESGVGAALVRN